MEKQNDNRWVVIGDLWFHLAVPYAMYQYGGIWRVRTWWRYRPGAFVCGIIDCDSDRSKLASRLYAFADDLPAWLGAPLSRLLAR